MRSRRWRMLTLLSFGLVSSHPGFCAVPGPPVQNRFGVLIGGAGADPRIANVVKDLGVGWVRINDHLDGHDPDFELYLEAGIDLVITFDNHDPANADTTYGTPRQWPNAGFPYKSKSAYQARIRDVLTPLLPYLSVSRRIMVQCENEVGDASLNPKARYWRGTGEQYLAQLQAFNEAVRSVHPALPVVLTSVASGALDAAISANDPRHAIAVKALTSLLSKGRYDAADLHFYGCAEDIATKIQWVKEHMPVGREWISTENGAPDPRCPKTPLSWSADPARFERLQAEQIPTRLSICADNGAKVSLVFSLFDLRGEDSVFSHLGLLDQATTPPRKKPAYEALKTFIASQR